MPVNCPMEFLPGGTVVTDNSANQEISRATYAVGEGAVICTDAKGE